MKIAIFGTGYVGLVSGVCFADMGNHVTCVDIDASKVERLVQGHSPIFEPGLEALLKQNLDNKRINFTTDAKAAVDEAEVIFIAVGTPPGEDGSADLSYVLAVAKTIGEHLQHYAVIVNKSTVPVGTVEQVKQAIQNSLTCEGVDFDVVSNPEFLKEGSAINDCMKPDRIIIGSDSKKAANIMHELYKPFNRSENRVMEMDPRSAEMTKYVANAMLATKISFINEMSQLSTLLGADIEAVRQGIAADQRIGKHFIYPGCGYGGSCFPKDVKALKHMAMEHGYDAHMLTSVTQVNVQQKKVLFEKINKCFNGDLKAKVIAIWGVAFKPNTDDIREASSRVLIEMLWEAGATVRLYDPEALGAFQKTYGEQGNYVCCADMYEALEGADVLAIVTEWSCFRSPDFEQIVSKLRRKVVFDGRNMYEGKQLAGAGLEYVCIGRPVVSVP